MKVSFKNKILLITEKPCINGRKIAFWSDILCTMCTGGSFFEKKKNQKLKMQKQKQYQLLSGQYLEIFHIKKIQILTFLHKSRTLRRRSNMYSTVDTVKTTIKQKKKKIT